jgi:ribonuclease P protein component
MISKKNRLSEKEVKKVLTRWKPFFSYGIVLNYLKNTLDINRYAIVIWWKSVKTNVVRNYFRRSFYDLVKQNLQENKWLDFVFVIKKQTKLDKNDENSINSFKNDISFLLNKIK